MSQPDSKKPTGAKGWIAFCSGFVAFAGQAVTWQTRGELNELMVLASVSLMGYGVAPVIDRVLSGKK